MERLFAEWERGRIRYDGQRAVVDDEVRSWYRGVHGERRVAAELAKLGSGWLTLHSVPVGRGSTDIDHVVIGAPGVFVINAKYSPGRNVWAKGYGILIDGHRTGFVPKAIAEARRASESLSRASGLEVPVTAVIAFVEPSSMSVGGRVGGNAQDPDVWVVRHTDLPRLLGGRPVFRLDEFSRLTEAAVRPETWHRSPAPTSAFAVDKEFQALAAAVDQSLNEDRPAARPARKPHPSRSRPARKRTRGKSRLELLIEGLLALALPITGVAILWSYLNSLAGR